MVITDFSFNENALFLKIIEGTDMGAVMRNAISEAQHEREGNCFVKFERTAISAAHHDMLCSFVAFKRKMRPSCFPAGVVVEELWKERRLAYLLVVEYRGYVVILKRNISTIKKLREVVENIDYNVLCKVFVDDHTQYKRFGMNNLDLADYAMRSKSFVAENLEAVFSTLGANNYALSSFQLKNNDGIYSLSLDTSKINQPGQKADINTLLSWSKAVIDKIAACNDEAVSNYLSVFATPVDYLTEFNRGNLDAKAILFSLYKLRTEDWIESITKEDEEEPLELNGICDIFKNSLDLIAVPDHEHNYYVDWGEERKINVIVSERGVSFTSEWLNSIKLNPSEDDEEHDEESLASYIRNTGAYTVMFDSPTLKYSNRKLFKDAGLTGNVEVFLNLFEDDADLVNTTSEKGDVAAESTVFEEGSLFRFTEDKYSANGKIMVCDDLGTEWADHILIGEDSVALFAAKHKDLCFSASAFQEVVGQAQKNLGVFFPLDSMWDSKIRKWRKQYKLDHVQSQINRVRTEGKTPNDAVDMWKRAEKQVNYQKDLFLVIDFISKDKLTTSLRNLRDGVDFAEKKEAIPILWLISSLWSSCQDMHIRLHITCQP